MPTKPLPSIFESKETINKRVKSFLEDKHALLSNRMQETAPLREETKWVWYPKEYLQIWLDEMDALGADGLRIYFGQKEITAGDEDDLISQVQKAAGQLCLIMLLTKPGEGQNSHINIIYEELSDFEERKQLLEQEQSKIQEQPMQFNFGGYSPPMGITEGPDFPYD